VSAVTVNGRAALWGEFHLPRIGVWYGDFGLARDTEALALTGAVEVQIGSLIWRGTVRRSGENKGAIVARVVGGGDGLRTTVPAKAYQGVPIRIPLEELLAEVGETLAPTTDPTFLATVLPQWTRTEGPASAALTDLLDAGNAAAWRILRDGTLWIGSETWRPSEIIAYTYLQNSPGAGFIDISPQGDPAIFPGEVFRDRPVSTVIHRLSGRRFRTRIWVEDYLDATTDRIRAGISAFVKSQLPNFDFLAAHWARVVAQNADGTLELVPDDSRIPGRSNVPIRYGVPGVKATVAPGARVLLEFAGGDPSKPFATVWESAAVTKMEITATEVDVTATTVKVDATQVTINSGVLPVAKEGSALAGTAGPFAIVGTVAVGAGSPTVRVP
jgi:hypothetical protein